MENSNTQDLTIDLSMFVTSLKTLRENLTYVEMDQILRDIVDANNRGMLEELLTQAEGMYKSGCDLNTAVHYAHFDIVEVQGEDF